MFDNEKKFGLNIVKSVINDRDLLRDILSELSLQEINDILVDVYMARKDIYLEWIDVNDYDQETIDKLNDSDYIFINSEEINCVLPDEEEEEND